MEKTSHVLGCLLPINEPNTLFSSQVILYKSFCFNQGYTSYGLNTCFCLEATMCTTLFERIHSFDPISFLQSPLIVTENYVESLNKPCTVCTLFPQYLDNKLL